MDIDEDYEPGTNKKKLILIAVAGVIATLIIGIGIYWYTSGTKTELPTPSAPEVPAVETPSVQAPTLTPEEYVNSKIKEYLDSLPDSVTEDKKIELREKILSALEAAREHHRTTVKQQGEYSDAKKLVDDIKKARKKLDDELPDWEADESSSKKELAALLRAHVDLGVEMDTALGKVHELRTTVDQTAEAVSVGEQIVANLENSVRLDETALEEAKTEANAIYEANVRGVTGRLSAVMWGSPEEYRNADEKVRVATARLTQSKKELEAQKAKVKEMSSEGQKAKEKFDECCNRYLGLISHRSVLDQIIRPEKESLIVGCMTELAKMRQESLESIQKQSDAETALAAIEEKLDTEVKDVVPVDKIDSIISSIKAA